MHSRATVTTSSCEQVKTFFLVYGTIFACLELGSTLKGVPSPGSAKLATLAPGAGIGWCYTLWSGANARPRHGGAGLAASSLDSSEASKTGSAGCSG